MNPYVFFVGCPRSGTTLVGRIGDAHPELAVIHETRFIAEWFEQRNGLTPEGHVTPAFIERLAEYKRFPTLDLERAALEPLLPEDRPVAYAEFVASLFDLYGERRGKRLVGDKTPRYVRFLPTLHELWPHARFVHIVRDGRDVCLSVLDWGKGPTKLSTFDDDPFTTIGVWWDWHVRLGREAGSRLGRDLYHELRYESLVEDPAPEAVALCAFLGIPYDASMLRFHEGRTRREPGLSAKSAWLPVTPRLRDWRTAMDADDVLRFEAAAGELLDELGYPRAASVSRKALDRTARVRERFVETAHARRRPLPRAWAARGGRS